MSIEEHEIFKAQIRVVRGKLNENDGMCSNQKGNITYLDERIYVYLLAFAMLALLALWVSSSSAVVLYGSLGLVILLTLVWGVARIRRIERSRRERMRQAGEIEARELSRNRLR